MAKRRSLDCTLPAPLDVGPAFKTGTRAASKRQAKRGGGAKRDQSTSHLTKKHASVRHLYACERTHCWQWVPDKKLSSLWRELDLEQRRQVLQTHEDDRLAKSFCEDIEVQMWSVHCCASENAKQNLNSMIWYDRSSLMLYKEIFALAVEENVPMVINMEVVASVDGVVQDFCAARSERRQEHRWDWTLVVRALLLAALLLWVVESRFAMMVAVIAIIVWSWNAWNNLLPLDPRTFPEGSALWVEYREREHVRLMLMSAMVRVFEVRLLRIWESRRKADLQQRYQTKAASQQEHTDSRPDCSEASLVDEHGANSRADAQPANVAARREPSGDQQRQRRKRVRVRKREDSRLSAGGQEQTAAGLPAGEAETARTVLERGDHGTSAPAHDVMALQVSHKVSHEEERIATSNRVTASLPLGTDCTTSGAEEGNDTPRDSLGDLETDRENGPDEGDEIDAEFARLAREHQVRREKAASMGSQTDRGNQILKSLCEKLKLQLEHAVPS